MDQENWALTEEVTDFFDSATQYNRTHDDDGHNFEYVKLEVPSKNGEHPGTVNIYIGEDNAQLTHETNQNYKPLINVLDEEYPPQRQDEMWIGDSSKYARRQIGSGFEEEVHTFQFYRNEEPIFDLEWFDLSADFREDYPAKLGLTIKSYDPFGVSLRKSSSDPFLDFFPPMIRTDLPSESKGKLAKEAFQILDYGVADNRQGTPLAHYIGEREMGRMIDNGRQNLFNEFENEELF